jgi:hypothetical protein
MATQASMIRMLLCCAALVLGSPVAIADAAKPFLGKWNVEWQTEQQLYEAAMQITPTGGTWYTTTRRRSNPCFGRDVPIRHDKATDTTLEMTLLFAEVIPDCKDVRVRLQLDDKGEVVGKRSTHELKLKRD